jgi:hypothetical protein
LRAGRRALNIRRDAYGDAGLLSIEGHILLQLGRLAAGTAALARSLDLRVGAGDVEKPVAEAKADLGYAYFLTGRLRRAEALVREGVAGLEQAMNPEFASRAQRKLAEFYLDGMVPARSAGIPGGRCRNT